MMRSLYAGVSGLQNHQTRMDVIGNNLANVNTTGFKKGRVDFQDLLSQSMKGAARPDEDVGGVNPQQVGLGMTIAAIDTIHTQGSLQTTGVKTDVAITGNGFFIMRNGETNLYTRAGAFGLDAQGRLVNPSNGMRVQGWLAETVNGTSTVDTAKSIQDIVIPVGSKDPAKATENVYAVCNLQKDTPIIPPNADAETVKAGTWPVTYDIYDSTGGKHQLQVTYTRDPQNPNTWIGKAQITEKDGTVIVPTLSVANVNNAANDNNFTVRFDNDGTLASVGNAANGNQAAGKLGVKMSFLVPNTAVPAGANPADPRYAAGVGNPITQTFTFNVGEVGSTENSTTQFTSKSSNKIVSQDGYTMGYLDDFRIDQSGTITGIFSNGTNRPLGQMALASFVNPGGLEKAGENNYAVSINSGAANVGPSGLAGKGKFVAGALEMSNVDLSETFTDMIVTQRGFQANSKTIQTADQMLQELLQLKR